MSRSCFGLLRTLAPRLVSRSCESSSMVKSHVPGALEWRSLARLVRRGGVRSKVGMRSRIASALTVEFRGAGAEE